MLYSSYNNKFQVSKIKLWFNIRPHSWRSRVLCTCRFTIHHVDILDRFYQRTMETEEISLGKSQWQARTRTTDYISLYSKILLLRLHIQKAPQSSHPSCAHIALGPSKVEDRDPVGAGDTVHLPREKRYHFSSNVCE